MTFEWDCQAAMAASERLKAMAEDTSCEAPDVKARAYQM